jgi:hypothetical protein
MQSYSVRDVERVLRLSRSTIQGLIKGGFVSRRAVRVASIGSRSRISSCCARRARSRRPKSARRIHRSLEDLRQHSAGDRAAVGPEHPRGRRPRGGARWQDTLAGRRRAVRARARRERSSGRTAGRGATRARERKSTEQTARLVPEGLELESRQSARRAGGVRARRRDEPHNRGCVDQLGRLLHVQGGAERGGDRSTSVR